MRYYYTNDGGLCELLPIQTKEYTLEELYLVYDDMKSKYRLTKSKYDTAEEEITAYVREHTLNTPIDDPMVILLMKRAVILNYSVFTLRYCDDEYIKLRNLLPIELTTD